jgi:hypothetical protein
MKIVYKDSIKEKVDNAIGYSNRVSQPIEFIILDKDEYIQFLEELDPVSRVLLTLPERAYRGTSIKVNY